MCQKCDGKGVIFIKCCNGQYCTCEGLPVDLQPCCKIDESKMSAVELSFLKWWAL